MTQLQIYRDEKSKPNDSTINCRYNERLVLHLIRTQKSASKASLARMSGLTAAAIGGIITSLQRKGLVEPAGKIQGDMGQPATLFRLVPQGAFGLGLSINRGSIETLITNFIGEKVTSRKHDMILPEPHVVMDIVSKDIAELQEELSEEHNARIVGLGVAQPFHLGSWPNESPEWHSWRNFDLNEQIKATCGIPVFGENDANAAALAELVYGLGQVNEDFVYFYFGSAMVSSLGGGIVLNKEIRRGFYGNAGDIGLMRCPAGPLAEDQNQETTNLVSRVCLNSLAQHLARSGANVSTHEAFTEATLKYQDQVNAWLDDCVSALKYAIQNIQALVDVPVIVFDSEDRDRDLIQKIVDKVDSELSTLSHPTYPMPNVRLGTLGSKAAAVGAATLPLDHHFSLKTDQK